MAPTPASGNWPCAEGSGGVDMVPTTCPAMLCGQMPMCVTRSNHSSVPLPRSCAPRHAPQTLAIGLLARITQFLGELPTQALDPPTLFFIWRVVSRLSTLEIKKQPRVSTLRPRVGRCNALVKLKTCSLKIDEIDKSISSIQASKSPNPDFRHLNRAKVCYSNGNVRFENFMHLEWSKEKF